MVSIKDTILDIIRKNEPISSSDLYAEFYSIAEKNRMNVPGKLSIYITELIQEGKIVQFVDGKFRFIKED